MFDTLVPDSQHVDNGFVFEEEFQCIWDLERCGKVNEPGLLVDVANRETFGNWFQGRRSGGNEFIEVERYTVCHFLYSRVIAELIDRWSGTSVIGRVVEREGSGD